MQSPFTSEAFPKALAGKAPSTALNNALKNSGSKSDKFVKALQKSSIDFSSVTIRNTAKSGLNLRDTDGKKISTMPAGDEVQIKPPFTITPITVNGKTYQMVNVLHNGKEGYASVNLLKATPKEAEKAKEDTKIETKKNLDSSKSTFEKEIEGRYKKGSAVKLDHPSWSRIRMYSDAAKSKRTGETFSSGTVLDTKYTDGKGLMVQIENNDGDKGWVHGTRRGGIPLLSVTRKPKSSNNTNKKGSESLSNPTVERGTKDQLNNMVADNPTKKVAKTVVVDTFHKDKKGNIGKLRLRDDNGNIIDRFKAGTKLKPTGEEKGSNEDPNGRWLEVKTKEGKTGWVSADYVRGNAPQVFGGNGTPKQSPNGKNLQPAEPSTKEKEDNTNKKPAGPDQQQKDKTDKGPATPDEPKKVKPNRPKDYSDYVKTDPNTETPNSLGMSLDTFENANDFYKLKITEKNKPFFLFLKQTSDQGNGPKIELSSDDIQKLNTYLNTPGMSRKLTLEQKENGMSYLKETFDEDNDHRYYGAAGLLSMLDNIQGQDKNQLLTF